MAIAPTFRIEAGARLEVARRGPRRPIGPAVARIDAAGRTPDAAAIGFAAAAGGGRISPAGTDPEDAPADGFTDVARHLDVLTGLHRCRLEPADRPVVARLAHDQRIQERELRRRATADLPGWRLDRRWVARREARRAATEAQRRRRRLPRGRAGSQESADAWWERLLANEPAAVTTALVRAFADHGFGAAAASVDRGSADLVVSSEPADVLIGRWQPRDDAAPARMPRPRRHELHAEVVGSVVLALAAEAFAVAPALTGARVAVLQPDSPDGLPGVLAVAELARSEVLPEGADTPAIDDLHEAARDGRVDLTLAPHGPAGALVSLDRSRPDLARLLAALTVT